MNWGALKYKQDCLFCSSEKRREGFAKINDSVKSSLKKWIISHPQVIQYPITNDYIKVKRVMKTEICQKVLLQVSVCELHIDTKKCYWFFYGI